MLENRTAVITGATGGLGSAVTRRLADMHVNLALLDIDEKKLALLAGSLASTGVKIVTHVVNLLDPAETTATAHAVLQTFGKADILLHLVGGWTGGKSIPETPRSDLEFMLNQHIWTSFNVAQAFIPPLIWNGWGRIIMITSPYASRPESKGSAFAIGKAGQESLMLTLARELKGTGVTANLLQVRTIDMKREKVTAPTPENNSWTTPEELVNAIVFLLSDEASAINGAKLPMYGSY
jgi:NAD(P)-dependent dehydrogenase (short-subunit alcohol dehydrogenase family)